MVKQDLEPRELVAIYQRLAKRGYTHGSITAAIEHRDIRLARRKRT